MLCLYASSIGSLYVACFFFGLALIGRFTCAFVLLTESLCERHKVLTGTLLLTMDAAATMYVTAYIRYVTINAQSLIWIGFTLNLISFIFNLWSCENPAWLVEVGEIEHAIKNLNYIAKFNGITNLNVTNLIANADEAKDPKQRDSIKRSMTRSLTLKKKKQEDKQ